jgi:hypothetical protein
MSLKSHTASITLRLPINPIQPENYTPVRLEMGIAHQCIVDETNYRDNQTLTTFSHDFICVEPVGGTTVKDRWRDRREPQS